MKNWIEWLQADVWGEMPPLPQGMQMLGSLAVFGLLMMLVLWVLKVLVASRERAAEKGDSIVTDWLGWRWVARLRESPVSGRIVGFLGLAIAVVMTALFVGLLFLLFKAAMSPDDGADVRNIGLVLAAMIGAPFVVWRSAVAAKQANTQVEALFNDKINSAAGDLAARRQVTKDISEAEGKTVLADVWQDDLVTRAAAIDRLEGLVEERPETAPRVARLLSIYVRELSQEHQALDHPRLEWLRRKEGMDGPEQDDHQIFDETGISPEDASIDSLTAWAQNLEPVRSDMEKAAQTLGRLKDIPLVDAASIAIDLRGANLQGFDLQGLCFDTARMEGARMEGADLSGARMERANLSRARMEWADLSGARMERANLRRARMEVAILFGARMERANLSRARMEGADLGRARMEGADLSEARMERANLRRARMEGANLGRARMDSDTSLNAAALRGAALGDVDYTNVSWDQSQIDQTFGDASVRLPKDMKPPPHWPDWAMDWPSFDNEWSKWQADPASYIPPKNPS